MTTAVGEVARNYAALADDPDYTDPQFAYPTGSGLAQILSGRFRYVSGASAVAHRYTGAMDGGEIRSKIEVGTLGSGGDEIGAAIINADGDGYALKLQSATSAVIVRLDAMNTVDFLDSATVSAATGDVWELRRNGTTYTVYKNGVQDSNLTATDATVTTGLAPAPMVVADNLGAATIISWAGDGIASNTYSLTAEQGSYVLTGQVATLRAGGFITAEFGSYSLLGSEALRDIEMDADQGSYALNGQNAGLLGAFTLTAEHGLYSLIGQAANILYSVAASIERPKGQRRFYGFRLSR